MFWTRLTLLPKTTPRSATLVRGLKEIKITSNSKNHSRTIEGVYVESDRKERLFKPQSVGSSGCHPFCKFSESHNVKHTDVLILNQFVDDKGKMLDRIDTGLCKRQYLRVLKLIKMSQKAGIMDAPKNFYVKDNDNPWDKNNTYWDERTIDIQWTENERLSKIREFNK